MRNYRLPAIMAVLATALLATPGAGIQVMISYPVLERAVAKELFREEGRYYISGSSADACSYTFVERPRLGAEAGRLVLRLHLSARLGQAILGQCVGPSEAFEVVVSGVPKVDGGSVVLADPLLSLPDRPQYEGLLRPFVTGPLAQALRFNLAAEIGRLTEGAAREGYRIQIDGLVLSGLRAAPNGLEVEIDFRATVTASPAP